MSEHKSIRDSLIEQLMSLEDIQLEIDGLIAQITEAEQKYANIEAMLQKVEVAWTQEEKSTYSNKKTLRDKERIVLAELSMFRRRLNDLLVEKLTLLQINAPQRTNVPSLEVNNMKSIITESIFSMSSASRISSDEVSQGSEYREEVSVGFATKFTQSIAALFKKPSKSTDMLVAETGKGASLEVKKTKKNRNERHIVF